MEKNGHELIICIVNNGFTDLVMDAARKEGARGGTIFHGRGTGNPEMEKFFGISISPEKEIVIILVEAEIKEAVLKAVNKAAGLETNGKGIAFSLPVSDVVGA
ncbi:MAG: P-II family nitrogen regulator [Erysipelotrichia bacterium]|nr:P-II family nitrogen regulator [Bacilli bacterium]MDD4005590.1 P-II family nitrogen regulator [Bacilli bacterium]NMV82117.1 P-II family nitrogen regulator [Erysipelotrichia bacterium]